MNKKVFYRFFSLIFHIYRAFPVKDASVVMLSPHKGGPNDSLHVLEDYLKKKNNYRVKYIFPVNSFSSLKSLLRFFIVDTYILARGHYIFMNDNFMPLAYLNFSKKAIITQLWHGEGAFKKFGLGSELPNDIAEIMKTCANKLSYVVCTSENVASIYAEAFGIPKNKVLPFGSPRSDRLSETTDTTSIRKNFDKAHPECTEKRLVLYAPTFRDSKEKDAEILNNIDADMFTKRLGDNYSLLVKLHPQVHSSSVPSNVIDVTAEDIYSLSLISDVLITDYSSVCMDFALLGKKCIFFAYDKEDYSNIRSFYYNYDSYVPGKVLTDFSKVVDEISGGPDLDKLNRFVSFNFDYNDNKTCERIFNRIF